jgi:sugar lactone lactonase YvrE
MQSTSAKTLVDDRSGLVFAKSPRWVGRELLFLDIHDKCVKSADLHGTVRVVTTLRYLPASFGVLPDGRLIVGDAWRRKIYRLERAGQEKIADLSHIARSCLSDGIVDSRGGMYVGDVGFDFLDPLVDPVPDGVIVHVSAKGESSVVAGDLFFPSGMIVTPNHSTLIVAEMLAHRLTAFDIDDDGSLGNRRVWAQFQDEVKPDGICLDREGAIWVAGAGLCALHVREGGEVDKQITTSRPVFDAMLGGPEGKHLFICTSTTPDPVITRRTPGATIDIAEVDTPGVEFPGSRALMPDVCRPTGSG